MNTRYENMAKTFMTGYNHDLFVSEHVQTAAHVLRQHVFNQHPFLWEVSETTESWLPYYYDYIEPFEETLFLGSQQQWFDHKATVHGTREADVTQHGSLDSYVMGILDDGVFQFDQYDLQIAIPGWLTLIATLHDAHAMGACIMEFERLCTALLQNRHDDLQTITTVLVEHTFIAMHDALEQVEIRDHVPWAWQHPLIVEQFVPHFLEYLAHVPQLFHITKEYETAMQSMDAAIAAAGFS